MKRKIAYFIIVLTLVSCSASKQYKKYENPINLFPFGVDGRWGFVDSVGNIKIEPKFEETRLFEHGLAVARYRGKYGYVDYLGKWVIKPKFDEAGDFYFGCAEIVFNNKTAFITRKGKVNKHCELWNIVPGCLVPRPPANPNEYSIKKGEKYALTYRSKKDTTEYMFDSVKRFNHEFITVSKNGRWGFHYLYSNRPN